MYFKNQGGLSWLQFDLLAEVPGLVHGVFSRQGGGSTLPFQSLNAALSVGDKEESVQRNRLLIEQALQLPVLLSMKQVHGSEVVSVDGADGLANVCCDGLMTKARHVGLMVLHADCQAALFYDPIHRVVAAVHAGWRGQVQYIYKKCVEKMIDHVGTRPQDLLVCISPSLGPSHAEFRHFEKEFPQEFWSFQEKNCHFNLWDITRHQLEACGVLPHHIEIAKVCTYVNEKDYFSYRRDGLTGRNATVIGLL